MKQTTHKAKGDARFWPRRHRLQHQTGEVLDPRTSKRFGREFEAAVRQRGVEAKAVMDGGTSV